MRLSGFDEADVLDDLGGSENYTLTFWLFFQLLAELYPFGKTKQDETAFYSHL